jgi:hypothetical protein
MTAHGGTSQAVQALDAVGDPLVEAREVARALHLRPLRGFTFGIHRVRQREPGGYAPVSPRLAGKATDTTCSLPRPPRRHSQTLADVSERVLDTGEAELDGVRSGPRGARPRRSSMRSEPTCRRIAVSSRSALKTSPRLLACVTLPVATLPTPSFAPDRLADPVRTALNTSSAAPATGLRRFLVVGVWIDGGSCRQPTEGDDASESRCPTLTW